MVDEYPNCTFLLTEPERAARAGFALIPVIAYFIKISLSTLRSVVSCIYDIKYMYYINTDDN